MLTLRLSLMDDHRLACSHRNDNIKETHHEFARHVHANATSCAGVPAPCAAAAGGTGKISTGGIQIPSQMRQYTHYDDIDMKAGSLGIEYKVMPGWRGSATYLDSRRKSPESNTQLLITDTSQALAAVNPTQAPFRHTDGRYYVMQYDYANPMIWTSNRAELFERSVKGLVLKSTFTNREWRVDSGLTLSNAPNSWYQSELDVRNRAKPVTAAAPHGNGVAGTLRMGSGPDDYYAAFNQSTPVITPANLAGTWSGQGQERSSARPATVSWSPAAKTTSART